MSTLHWLILIYWLLTWGVLGFAVGRRKNRSSAGVLLGVLFGPLGVAVTLALEPAVVTPAETQEARTARIQAEMRADATRRRAELGAE